MTVTGNKIRAEVNPTEKDLEAYFKVNQALYMVPESRNLTILIADQAKIADSLVPSDADLLWQTGMDDDHMPFLKAGIPSVDLIDFTYGYNNVFWHTPEDTVDKLGPQSLAITGDVVLETVRLINAR